MYLIGVRGGEKRGGKDRSAGKGDRSAGKGGWVVSQRARRGGKKMDMAAMHRQEG